MLEELRVPVDVIAGTSIGAIVGGLYSTGLTSGEISQAIDSLDWQELFRGTPPRDELAYRRKHDDVRFPVQLELGLDAEGVHLPRGLITGQALHVLLSGFGIPVGSVLDFDDLPIPFRAVAADLEDGTPIALAEGDFAQAIRASMSIPGIFVPVEIGGRQLIDGGISQNVPVRVAQAMGADILIVVDVATPSDPIEKLSSAFAISRQVVRFPTQRATQSELDLLDDDQDVTIIPDLTGIGTTDFPSTLQAANAGAEAALAAKARFAPISLSTAEYNAWRTRVRLRRQPVPVVDTIVLNNPSTLADRQLGGLIRQVPGTPLDVAILSEDLARIYGLGFFESVTYRVESAQGRDGSAQRRILVIDVVPQPWGPHYLRLGLGFQDNLGGTSAFSLRASYTLTQLNGWGADLRNHLEFGWVRRLFSEWYQPLGGGGAVFLAPSLEYQRQILDVFNAGARVAQRSRTHSVASFDVGVRLGNWGELRTGIQRGTVDLETRTGPADSLDAFEHTGALRGVLAVDRLNDRNFPRSGDALQIDVTRSLEGVGGPFSYAKVEAQLLQAFPVRRGTVLLQLRAGTAFGAALPTWDEFELGGLFAVSGLRERELTGSEAALAGLTFYHPIATLPTTLSGGDLLVGTSVEAGNTWHSDEKMGLVGMRVGASLFVGLETILGPIHLGYGRADRGQGAWYFFLGRTF